MAAQLPGRTDNEIKNYWNTRLKRFQRQGLPLYPPDISQNNHQQQQQEQETYLQQPNTPCSPLPSPTPASSFSFHTPTIPLFTFPKPPSPSLRPKRSYDTAFNSLSTKPPYTSSPTTFLVSSPSFLHTPSSYQSSNPVYSMKHELPSNQIPYSASLGVYQVSNFSDNAHCNQNLNTGLHISTCQLLEDVMEEVEALADSCWAPKRRQLMDNNFVFSGSFGHSNNICSLQGLKPKDDESLQMNTMQDEDIAKLLDWGTEIREISNGKSSALTAEENLVFDDHQFALLFQFDDDNNTNSNLTISSCSWDNLPEIC